MAVAAQTLLDNLDDAINNFLANGAVQSYTINGRTVQRPSLAELMTERRRLLGEIAAAKTAGGGAVNYFRRGAVD